MFLQSVIDIRGNLPASGSAAVQTDLGVLIASFVGLLILVGAIATLVFMMIGAVQWITAGGDKGKIDSARNKITQAIIGLAIVVSVFALFGVVQYFFGVNIVRLSGGSGGVGGGGGGAGSSGAGAGVGCTVGRSYSDGGAGGYCRGGEARVNCVEAGSGPSRLNFVHFEPCDCVSGTRNPAYTFMADCYPG